MNASKSWPSFIQLWGLWILVTALGSAGAGALGAAGSGGDPEVWGLFGMPIACFTGGIFIGIGQELILHKKVRKTGLWTLATFVGRFLGWPMAAASVLPTSMLITLAIGHSWVEWERNSEYFQVATVLVAGAILGTVQGMVLCTKFKRVHWWVLASSIGWALGVVAESWVVRILEPFIRYNDVALVAFIGFAYGATSGVVAGAVTGVAMALLLTRGKFPD
ncbi:MAG: hypothetical protein GY832_18330 [Chloroflexi bacterium]|nr:hypothetical protein [Chloroflexota bacterium]